MVNGETKWLFPNYTQEKKSSLKKSKMGKRRTNREKNTENLQKNMTFLS